jgi:glycosyltransferase involved in cell wall biosynthesis
VKAQLTERPSVALLTGGGDRPYAHGLASSLVAEGISLDFIGSDELDAPELHQNPRIRFLNLRGDQRPDVSVGRKAWRVATYYLKLLRYAAGANPRIFHILWNTKPELLDRTLVLLYYRLLNKRLVFTAHNVNARKRDGNDGPLNRFALRTQYRLVDHIFVHTNQMRDELQADFNVSAEKITVIPFGINSTIPDTAQTPVEARERLGLAASDKVVLFFGNIAPYKGLEYLVEAMSLLAERLPELRLVIAGRVKGVESYWAAVDERITALGLRPKILQRIEFVPDAETETYFKAADVLVLPYVHVFQSGVLFLGYNFGLPIIASDVASLREDIVEGETGFVCEPCDPASLARALERYFASELYRELDSRRPAIRRFATERYSWTKVASMTKDIYDTLDSDRLRTSL